MVTTICFLDDVEKALNEAQRVLKPDGHIIIGFIDAKSPMGNYYKRHKAESKFYQKATFLSVKEVIFHLKNAHFKDLHFRQTLFHHLNQVRHTETVKKGMGKVLS